MAVIDQRTDGRNRALRDARRSRLTVRFSFLALLILGSGIGSLVAVRIDRAARQLHRDPKVGTVWVAGVTYGPKPTLRLGNPLQSWLNRHGIRAFGKTDTLVSRFSGGPGGLEIWFACRSSLRNNPLLECHRVGRTAFTDDLGQEYQGYLDFHGSYVGIYLPGYDRAASRLNCDLHWMPRSPALPRPISAPMQFQIDLPHASRLLPPANRVTADATEQTKNGITVEARGAHLESPRFSATPGSQRDLIFHLDVRGGRLACSNVDESLTKMAGSSDDVVPDADASAEARRLAAPWNIRRKALRPLEITDPYGISMLSPQEKIMPMMSLDATRCTQDDNGTVWIAPITGGGQGTDMIRLHLYIQPANRSLAPVPFDLILPVHSDDEI